MVAIETAAASVKQVVVKSILKNMSCSNQIPASLVFILIKFLCIVSGYQDAASAIGDGQANDETETTYFQPALIGFRCETIRDLTPKGVCVVEANTPVTLTLFGESFIPGTIIAFTPEFQPDYTSDATRSGRSAPSSPSGPSSSNTEPPVAASSRRSFEQQEVQPSSALATGTVERSSEPMSMIDEPNERLFTNRMRTRSRSYDCTDYNRVTSYRLSEENILSPNIASLTVTLPELDSNSGLYYYFCLKQPRLVGLMPGASPSNEIQASHVYNSNRRSNESLVWVHQGDDWWVTLKVEPPILSVANDCVLIVLLLCLSAVTSGLNLGLMSLDMNELAVISSCGDQRERSYARTIMPLRKRGNYLLCSLLLGNVMVNSTLTVILEEMTSGIVAVIGSTLAIVVLGEIVPQAMCARQGLAIGARTIYLTYAFMVLTFPLSYPISRLLDYVLGEEKGNVYDRERLMEFIKITGHHTQLESDEVAIISGALKLKKIKVDQIMTRIEDVFMLPIDCKLDRETIKRIIEKGYSRIPVYEFGDRKQIVALILAKDLALLDPDDHTPIANMLMYCKHPLIFIDDDATLDIALNEFKTGKSHMAVVQQIYDDGEVDKYYEAIGVVTLEDVIEEVLQVEINDETDTLSDNRRKRRRTDAQVAHLLDYELTSSQTHSTSGKLDCSLATAGGRSAASQTDLTSISVAGVVKSLAGDTSASDAGNTSGQHSAPTIVVQQPTGQQ